MYSLEDLSPDQCIPRKARVKKHNIGLQSSIVEGTLNPTDEISLDFLQKEELNVRDIVSVTPWDIELVTLHTSTPMRTGTPTPIRVVVKFGEARW